MSIDVLVVGAVNVDLSPAAAVAVRAASESTRAAESLDRPRRSAGGRPEM